MNPSFSFAPGPFLVLYSIELFTASGFSLAVATPFAIALPFPTSFSRPVWNYLSFPEQPPCATAQCCCLCSKPSSGVTSLQVTAQGPLRMGWSRIDPLLIQKESGSNTLEVK